jgi:hypothetical protein
METYRAPWWLPGAHAQTILAPLLTLGQRVDYDRKYWTTPDGDFIHVDWAGPKDAPRLLVLFHGLEGNSRSHYARAIVARALADGDWRCAVAHFRGCSGEPNLKPRAYHAGDSEEIDWILRRFADQHAAVHALGVSLGGNALLKWLGERGDAAQVVVRRAAAVSAPFDLTAFGHQIGRGFNRVYGWYFLYLTWLRAKALQKSERFPDEFADRGIVDARVRWTTTLPGFDDALTAPLHGFAGKDDYWSRASAAPWLPRIRVPTLLLNARNDPFMPAQALPESGELPPCVTTDFPKHGGHGGFPGCGQWLARRVLEHLAAT